MMSPEPPRSDNPESSSVPEGFAEFDLIEDDIMGEGEHMPDYSSQSESVESEDEYPSSEDGYSRAPVTNEDEDEDDIDEVGNTRVRAQYRLLIPFQVEQESENEGEDYDQQDHQTGLKVTHKQELKDEDDNSANSTVGVDNTESVSETTTRREIILNDDKVQTIKDAMRSFKLPDTAIPPWAQGISEDTWKIKLEQSMKSKNDSS